MDAATENFASGGQSAPPQHEFDDVNACDPGGLDPDDHDLMQVSSFI